MELHVAGSDVIGTCTSKTSGGAGGGTVSGTIKGWTSGDPVSFAALWPGGSITAWTGQIVNEGGERIHTPWHLVTDISDANEDDRLWQSTLAVADEFARA